MPLPRILFLCIENSNRSQMAQAFAQLDGADIAEAHSAGSHPSGTVNPKAIAAMQELGYDLSTHQSKSIADLPPDTFDIAITLGCGDACPLHRARHRIDWQIPDPKNLPPVEFNQVRDLIRTKVRELLKEIQTGSYS